MYGYAGKHKEKKNPKIQYTLKDGHKDKKTGTFSDSYLYLNNVYRIPIQNIKGILKTSLKQRFDSNPKKDSIIEK